MYYHYYYYYILLLRMSLGYKHSESMATGKDIMKLFLKSCYSIFAKLARYLLRVLSKLYYCSAPLYFRHSFVCKISVHCCHELLPRTGVKICEDDVYNNLSYRPDICLR